MSMEKDGYEVITDTTPANDLKKANRRWGLICADSAGIMKSGFNSQGADTDRNPAVPLEDGLNFYED